PGRAAGVCRLAWVLGWTKTARNCGRPPLSKAGGLQDLAYDHHQEWGPLGQLESLAPPGNPGLQAPVLQKDQFPQVVPMLPGQVLQDLLGSRVLEIPPRVGKVSPPLGKILGTYLERKRDVEAYAVGKLTLVVGLLECDWKHDTCRAGTAQGGGFAGRKTNTSAGHSALAVSPSRLFGGAYGPGIWAHLQKPCVANSWGWMAIDSNHGHAKAGGRGDHLERNSRKTMERDRHPRSAALERLLAPKVGAPMPPDRPWSRPRHPPPRRSSYHRSRSPGSRSLGHRPPPQHPRRRPRTHEAATWCIMEHHSLVGFASRLRWDRQPQVPQGLAPADVPAQFQGRTLNERCAEDTPLTYTDEERAGLCALCKVPMIAGESHLHGTLHTERRQRKENNASAATRPLTSADVEAALIVVSRSCPERLRAPDQATHAQEDVIIDEF
ncbi:hypothetical protein HPB47_018432, partial [Ixodes persulcatus]